MGNDQVMIGIHSDLHVVADDARAAAAGCHRATVGVGQRYLLVGRSQHLLLVDGKLAHLLFHLRQLLLEPCHLRGQRFGRLLPVGGVKLAQIAGNALLQLGTPPLHLCPREVPVPVVHGLELAAIDGNARRREKAHLTAKLNEARTDLAEPQAPATCTFRYENKATCEVADNLVKLKKTQKSATYAAFTSFPRHDARPFRDRYRDQILDAP